MQEFGKCNLHFSAPDEDDGSPICFNDCAREFANVDMAILKDVYKKLCSLSFTAGSDCEIFARILANGIVLGAKDVDNDELLYEASQHTNKSTMALEARMRRLIKSAFNTGNVQKRFEEIFGYQITDACDTVGKFVPAFIVAYRFKHLINGKIMI